MGKMLAQKACAQGLVGIGVHGVIPLALRRVVESCDAVDLDELVHVRVRKKTGIGHRAVQNVPIDKGLLILKLVDEMGSPHWA